MGSRRFRDVEGLIMKVLIGSGKKGILPPRVVGSFRFLKNNGKIVCILMKRKCNTNAKYEVIGPF